LRSVPLRRPGDSDVSEQREGGRFATASVRDGAIRSLPVAISGLFEGLVFGVLMTRPPLKDMRL
jgi:hypothetical protein